ncbi:MAG: excinuclease ATPase subunit [Ignavibacteria bacterium]
MRKVLLLSLGLSILAAPAWARNDKYILKWADVLESQEAKGRLDSSVKIYFGDGAGPEKAERQGGDDVVQIARGRGYGQDMREDDIHGCKLAALAALAIYQQKARQVGSTAVVDLISNYHNAKFSSATDYECHAGGTGSHVQFKANYAKGR